MCFINEHRYSYLDVKDRVLFCEMKDCMMFSKMYLYTEFRVKIQKTSIDNYLSPGIGSLRDTDIQNNIFFITL